ncbi:hypothetical protein ACSRUE_31640 [Sorangium sp. KYC3313]|uniref:hypothetical protein n=1 Tax=Sorangium sp. KYC3313 TaxID=3449740 RepID=UPI003F88AB46
MRIRSYSALRKGRSDVVVVASFSARIAASTFSAGAPRIALATCSMSPAIIESCSAVVIFWTAFHTSFSRSRSRSRSRSGSGSGSGRRSALTTCPKYACDAVRTSSSPAVGHEGADEIGFEGLDEVLANVGRGHRSRIASMLA